MATRTAHKQAPKGVRLGWTPMKEVKPVQLTSDMVKGVKVNQSKRKSSQKGYLIP